MRIANFSSACEAEAAKTHNPWRAAEDKLDYLAREEEPFSFASDMFSVGVILFEMATGKLPDPNNLDRNQLLATIDDPRKRELIAFALHVDPSKRPTAEGLPQKITRLAPS